MNAKPSRSGDPSGRGQPILITAELPDDLLAWADALRQRYYPPERNRLKAHVTLFHALPPSAWDEVRRLVSLTARETPPMPAAVARVMDLDDGTAWAVASPDLSQLHADMADRLTGIIQQRDDRPFRPHITVQAKVGRSEAVAVQSELASAALPPPFRFTGLGLYRWDGQLWRFERAVPFRGGG